MTQKTVDITGIGPVLLVKNRRSRSLKISLLADGKVRVSLPTWAPYHAAITFAQRKQSWINEHRIERDTLRQGQSIGKAHHLYFTTNSDAQAIRTRQGESELRITLPNNVAPQHSEAQEAARKLATRALRREAEQLLPSRLRSLAKQYGFAFNSVSVRQLKARWGSCTHQQDITLNLFLMQLPWELIDYVLIHELCHTKHLHHGTEFWQEFERVIPDAKKRRTAIRQYKPAI